MTLRDAAPWVLATAALVLVASIEAYTDCGLNRAHQNIQAVFDAAGDVPGEFTPHSGDLDKRGTYGAVRMTETPVAAPYHLTELQGQEGEPVCNAYVATLPAALPASFDTLSSAWLTKAGWADQPNARVLEPVFEALAEKDSQRVKLPTPFYANVEAFGEKRSFASIIQCY